MTGGQRAWLAAAAVLVAGCAEAPSGPANPGADPAPRSMADALRDRLDEWLREPGRRGVSAAVILGDGNTWEAAVGLAATGEPLRPDHLIAVGSITKTATAALLLRLSAEGRLALDDAVGSRVSGLAHVPAEVTLRQLLNHTGGLANYTSNPAFAAAVADDPAHRFSPREVLALFLEPPLFFPGTRTDYTNTSFLVLGLVAEAAGGGSVASQWRERFWGPLGLDEVFLPPDEAPRGAVANAWVGASPSASRETQPLRNVAGFSARGAAFGLLASPRDVARWGRSLFAGNVLDAAARAEMLRFVPPAGTIPQETGSGLGVRRYGYGGREQWGHSGAADEGTSLLLHEPSRGVTLALAMNQSPATHGSSHFALAGELLRLAAGR